MWFLSSVHEDMLGKIIATCKLFLTVLTLLMWFVTSVGSHVMKRPSKALLAVLTMVWFFTSVGADVILERLAKGKLPLTVVRSPVGPTTIMWTAYRLVIDEYVHYECVVLWY